jgi:hypothetical protein
MIKIGSSGTGAFFNALAYLAFSIQENTDDHKALWARNTRRKTVLGLNDSWFL